ncbi:hypothetical protein Dsin_005888 [Dipteronia sinensis]|uniref:RING-type domain-containing protein n=1 Tax=Dipteronia sinensis TaxID=43782 RepID=A0AAE0EF42_9ROSI|nr:hypothetical protein Dsin_005888 [Dipteronia sinensis]
MWSFASKATSGAIRWKNYLLKPSQVSSELSDDEISFNNNGGEEGLECPICWESFNIVENVPYVLWCGHTLCKNCVLGLQRAVVKLPTLPLHLPFFVTCPWCNLLSLRLVYKGNLSFPRKNYFLLWMVESMTGDRSKSYHSFRGDHQQASSLNRNLTVRNQVSHLNNRRRVPEQPQLNRNEVHLITAYLNAERLHLSLRKSLLFFAQLTTKLPLIVLLILIVMYAIPASAAILALYILITIVFVIPSVLVLYFAFPSLDWLVREIIT